MTSLRRLKWESRVRNVRYLAWRTRYEAKAITDWVRHEPEMREWSYQSWPDRKLMIETYARKVLADEGLQHMAVVWRTSFREGWLGQCEFCECGRTPVAISFNALRFRLCRQDRHAAYQTVAHEASHAVAGQFAAHGPEFEKIYRRICAREGLDADADHPAEVYAQDYADWVQYWSDPERLSFCKPPCAICQTPYVRESRRIGRSAASVDAVHQLGQGHSEG